MLKAADGIRGLACAIVLAGHAIGFFFPELGQRLIGFPKIGVWLFFVLSAFLLTHRLQAQPIGVPSLLRYFGGRVLRIYPPYALALLLYMAFGTTDVKTWGDVLDALLLRTGTAHFWTIPVEFKAYFAIPLLAWGLAWLHRRTGTAGVLATALALIVLQQAWLPYSTPPSGAIASLAYLMYYLPTFVLGVLAATLQGAASSRLPRWSGLLLLVILLAAPAYRYALCGPEPGTELLDKFLFFGLGWALFVVGETARETRLTPLLCSSALTALGRWSYSTYLLHWLVMVKLAAVRPHSVPMMLLGVALSVLAGWLSYRLVERPALGLRRRLARRSDAVDAGAQVQSTAP